MVDYSWFNKKYLRSIEQLRLWADNPRLNPNEQHQTLHDIIDDIIQEEGDKANFVDLVRSIASHGFIPADPIVVWKDTNNQHYYVAEGNRRVMALKLLRDPSRAPREIRGTISSLAKIWTPINKIYVNIAPSFEDAEWYISQRNSTSSVLKQWSRLQQMRWIESLYNKYYNSPEVLEQKCNMTIGEIENIIRYIRLLNLVNEDAVKSKLSVEDYRKAISHTFPITVFERFFSLTRVREAWGFEFTGTEVFFKNKSGFLSAFAEVIHRIVCTDTSIKLDTRNVSSDKIENLLDSLPKVDLVVSDPFKVGGKEDSPSISEPDPEPQPIPHPKPLYLKGDENRKKLILPCYYLYTSEARLSKLFEELKSLSVNKYVSVCAAAIRIFLELTVLDYIQAEGLEEQIKRSEKNDLNKIPLKTRLDFLSEKSKLKNNPKAVKILKDLINENKDYCLDILNGYVHSKSTVYINKQYLNRFWDSIFPLLQEMIDIREVQDR